MYPAIVLALLFVVLVACVHDHAEPSAKVFSGVAGGFALIAATVLILDYGIQLTVMQPSVIKGEVEGLSAFSQYNPRGVFIAMENIGYLMMALAFLAAAAVFRGRSGLERAIRWILVSGGALTVAALIAYSAVFGLDLDYRFEVAAIFVDWLVLIIAGILLSVQFRRSRRARTASTSAARARIDSGSPPTAHP